MDLTDTQVPANPSKELQTAIAWGNAFVNKNIEEAFSLVADDAKSRVLPKSLGSPEKTREQWKAHLTNLSGEHLHDIYPTTVC